MIAGHTDDYGTMVEHLVDKYPSTYVVPVGFSLGGNIVTKYMGEQEAKQPPNVIGGISICQGYNAVEYVSHCPISPFHSHTQHKLKFIEYHWLNSFLSLLKFERSIDSYSEGVNKVHKNQ